MSGPYSREALAAVLGPEAMARAEAEAAAAPPPSPQAVERLRQILAPAVERLMIHQQRPDVVGTFATSHEAAA